MSRMRQVFNFLIKTFVSSVLHVYVKLLYVIVVINFSLITLQLVFVMAKENNHKSCQANYITKKMNKLNNDGF